MPIFKTGNHNFFKKWTPAMAYILGFFAADGNLTLGKRGNHYLEFTSTDPDIIQKIRHCLGSNHKITRRPRKKNQKDSFRIQIGSKIIFQDLQKLGFAPNKSKTLDYPKTPKRYFKDFVRGYFDGDGHVITGLYRKRGRKHPNRILYAGFTSGTESFLEKLHRDPLSQKIVKGGTRYYSKGYRLNFPGSDSLGLYNFLYKNMENDLYLHRKKVIFEKFMKHMRP